MGRFIFTSRLEENHRDSLESLLYFNPGQDRVIAEVEKVIESWGTPEICPANGFLKVSLTSAPEVQSLFALDSAGEETRLAGLVVFTRQDEESLVILHLVVGEEYSANGSQAGHGLALSMLCRVREIARLIRGVRRIVLHYRGGIAVPVQTQRDRFLKETEELV